MRIRTGSSGHSLETSTTGVRGSAGWSRLRSKTIGDLNQRRGHILGIEPAGRHQRVRALVPQAELYKYATALRSLTQGRATHTRTFHAYEEVPGHEVPRVVESAKKEREELASTR